MFEFPKLLTDVLAQLPQMRAINYRQFELATNNFYVWIGSQIRFLHAMVDIFLGCAEMDIKV